MRGVGGVRKSIHQSWLAKGLGLGLLCWGLKGVQEEIPLEETRTLHIGSVVFPAGHNSILVTDYLTEMGIKTVPQPPYIQTLLPVTFAYSQSSQAVMMRQLRRWKRLWQRSLTHSHKSLSEVVGTVQQVHCSWRRLLQRGLEFNVCNINKSAHTKKKSGNLFNDPCIFIKWQDFFLC